MTERPRRMTIAAVVATTTCLLLVVTLLDAMAGLRTLDSVQRMRQLVDAQGWSGLRTEQVIGVQRTLIFVSGALAATGAVLSVYAGLRHRGARAGLSVVAALLLFSTALVATLLPMILLVAVVMMWTGEARDWLDGRERRPRPAAVPPAAPAPAQEHWPPPAPQPPPQPAPPPFAPPASYPYPRPSPTQVLDNPYAGPAYPSPREPRPSRPPGARPAAVSVAAWIAGVFGVLTFVTVALAVTVMIAARDEAVRALRDQNLPARLGLSERDLLAWLWVVCAVCLFWSLAAVVLAVLACYRLNLARLALAGSSLLAAVAGLVAHHVGVLNAVAALVTLALLFSPAANRWYAGRGTPDEGADGRADEGPDASAWTSPPQEERPRGKPPVW